VREIEILKLLWVRAHPVHVLPGRHFDTHNFALLDAQLGAFPLLEKFPVTCKDLNTAVRTVSYIHAPFEIQGDAVRQVELAGPIAFAPPVSDELPVESRLYPSVAKVRWLGVHSCRSETKRRISRRELLVQEVL
jgi:hypothetical protein